MMSIGAAIPRRRDSGETTTQLVLVLPIVIFVMVLGVQIAVHAHTSHVATAAAARGAAAGSTPSGTRATAVAAARQMVLDLGARMATSPTARSSTDGIIVTVRLVVPRLVPLFPRTVERRVVEPKERLTREWER